MGAELSKRVNIEIKTIVVITLLVLMFALMVVYNLPKKDYIEQQTGMTQEEFNNFQYKQAIELIQTGKADNGKTLAIPYNTSREQIKQILEEN